METELTKSENRLITFAHMIDKACGLSLWCFGMKKNLYTCTSVAEKEFRLFLDLGQCLDYATEQCPQSSTPILMSDSIGMLWVAECAWHGDTPSYLIMLGPVFDAAASLQTLQEQLRGMNLSVSLTATIAEKLARVPILPLPTLQQYIKMLHWVLTGEELDVSDIRLRLRESPPDTAKDTDLHWDPDRARLLEAEIMQQIREGNTHYLNRESSMGRFAEKDFYDLGSPLRESKDTAIIFTALCARAAMDGGLAPRIAKQLEIQYVRAVEHCVDMPTLMHVNTTMVTDFVSRVHACRETPEVSNPVQECCAYVHAHLLEEIQLADMAQAVGYTEYYLTKKFRRETGQKLTDYINRAKIQYACVQLRGSKKTLQEISEELHYSSRSYFTMVFQKEMGCSPTEYRNTKGE
ncbi:helix-turn-helix transcriptional regulator [Gemmiger sp.]